MNELPEVLIALLPPTMLVEKFDSERPKSLDSRMLATSSALCPIILWVFFATSRDLPGVWDLIMELAAFWAKP